MLLKLNESSFGDANPDQSFFFLYDEIHPQIIKELNTWMMDMCFQTKNKPKVLNLFLQSPGGCLFSTHSAISVIRGLPKTMPLRIVGTGLVASGGTMILLSGTKGYRTITPETSVLSHCYSSIYAGEHHQLVAGSKDIDLTYERMMNHYKRCTGLSEKKIKKYLLTTHDVYLSSKEALDLNVVDIVADLA